MAISDETKAKIDAKLTELQTKWDDLKAKAAASPIAADVQAVSDAMGVLIADIRTAVAEDDAA